MTPLAYNTGQIMTYEGCLLYFGIREQKQISIIEQLIFDELYEISLGVNYDLG